MDLNNQIIIYQTEDGQTQVDVRMENDTVWLTQKQIAELFGTKRPAITKHLKNIYASEELDESTCAKIAQVPFWNSWVMKEKADSVVVAKFANTTQHGAKLLLI